MTNLDRVLKSRHRFADKGPIVRAMVFSVVMWDLDNKKAWALKNWCFRIVVLEKVLESLLDTSWSNQSIQSFLKEINPEYSLEGLMLKLKLQYSVHLMRRADSLEKTLMLGKTEGIRRREWQKTRWLDCITDSVDMSVSKLQRQWRTGKSGVLQPIGDKESDMT